MIQNQIPSSRRSKKWDRQGTVVATGENDQYLVRVAGSGRLTLRNRRFLRKFQEQTRSRNIMESVEGLPAIAMPAINQSINQCIIFNCDTSLLYKYTIGKNTQREPIS